MTDRGRMVYALLRSRFAWAADASIRPRTDLGRVARGFVAGKDEKGSQLRYVTCPDCLTNDRVLASCESCGGRGEIPDDGPDPYDRGVSKGIVRGKIALSHRAADENDFLRATKARNLELRRLKFQLAKPAEKKDELVIDPQVRMIEARDRQYRDGDYEKLERALTVLREMRPVAYTAAMWVSYQPLGEAPIDCEKPYLVEICETLALLMDGPIRVPEDVPISVDEQTERLAREGKGALWRGRGDWHKMRRHERDALIAAMSAEGRPPGEIALRFNLTRKRVQQIVAEQAAKADGSATGPAA